MVHRIFKNIVSRTNRKNVDKDLLKRYNTLFAIRHLLEGGIDKRFSSSNNALVKLPQHLHRLMSNWFVFDEADDIKDDINEGMISSLNKITIFTYLVKNYSYSSFTS